MEEIKTVGREYEYDQEDKTNGATRNEKYNN